MARVGVSLGAAGVGLDLHGGVVRGLAVPRAQLDLEAERLVGGLRPVEEVGCLGAAEHVLLGGGLGVGVRGWG